MNGTETIGNGTSTRETERRRVNAVVETLAGRRQPGFSAAELAHEARNMVTALDLYCELLAEPGVLAPESRHYASELTLIASASRRLIGKLMLLETSEALPVGHGAKPARASQGMDDRYAVSEILPDVPIDDLRREVEASGNLLDAMAGMSIAVSVKTEGGARPVKLTGEDLTRVLVNLVKNAAEAMRRAGRIEIALWERRAAETGTPELVLTVEDNGPGIREGLLEQIFEPGFSTHTAAESGGSGWMAARRGLGLSITRSIVESAGGRIHAENRKEGGARIVIVLPAAAQ